ncbi:MAG TPA: DUF4129 domain-containing protein [Saprospiraceae bacterium]|nr:DUF4129 domain-containing protein [Saprospiraceae bacterium]HMQ85432.1 DUF4129 domain-containing protein [Saprospiraceae bacterium]
MIQSLKYHLLVLIFIPLTAILPAQEADERPFDEYVKEAASINSFNRNKWQELKEGIDYTETSRNKQKEAAHEAEKSQGRYDEVRQNRPMTVDSQLGNIIMKFILILGAVVIIVLLLRSILGLEVRPKNKKLRKAGSVGNINLEDIEANIYESDLNAYVRQALSQGQYSLAVRLYYLALLKELSLKKMIHWKRDKTNRQYLLEMNKTNHAEDFERITQTFEQVWYGDRRMDKADFEEVEPIFQSMIQRIVKEK